jgi:hypothetical protein
MRRSSMVFHITIYGNQWSLNEISYG